MIISETVILSSSALWLWQRTSGRLAQINTRRHLKYWKVRGLSDRPQNAFRVADLSDFWGDPDPTRLSLLRETVVENRSGGRAKEWVILHLPTPLAAITDPDGGIAL